MYPESMNSTREQVLRAAAKAVLSDRNKAYGEPEDNLGTTAELWSVFLGTPIRPDQVAACMALLKVARLRAEGGQQVQDTWVDLAGYAAIGAEVSARPTPE
jgi:Domain of unknown function (DUF6378)